MSETADKKILIVEDDADNIELLNMLLAKEGYAAVLLDSEPLFFFSG